MANAFLLASLAVTAHSSVSEDTVRPPESPVGFNTKRTETRTTRLALAMLSTRRGGGASSRIWSIIVSAIGREKYIHALGDVSCLVWQTPSMLECAPGSADHLDHLAGVSRPPSDRASPPPAKRRRLASLEHDCAIETKRPEKIEVGAGTVRSESVSSGARSSEMTVRSVASEMGGGRSSEAAARHRQGNNDVEGASRPVGVAATGAAAHIGQGDNDAEGVPRPVGRHGSQLESSPQQTQAPPSTAQQLYGRRQDVATNPGPRQVAAGAVDDGAAAIVPAVGVAVARAGGDAAVAAAMECARQTVREAYDDRTRAARSSAGFHQNRGRGRGGRGRGGRRNNGGGEGRVRERRDDTWAVRHMLNLLKRMLYERYLRRGHSLGDFCCGQGGDLAKAAYQKAASYVGVDVSSVALDEARFRAKTTPVVVQTLGEPFFIEQDLRTMVLEMDPALDVVSCQLALHYMWGTEAHANTFLTSVRDSLKAGGFFILTIVDADKIPAGGLLDHPYVRLTPPTSPPASGSLGASYRFSFPGLVNNVEEFVVPRADLIARCATFSLQFVDSFSIRDVLPRLMAMHPTKPPLSPDDWRVLDLYRAYAFQKC